MLPFSSLKLALQDFPAYILAFAKRFATGSYDTATVSPSLSNTTELIRDPFGMRKVIVAATRRGVVFGLDSSSGAILWKRILDLGWASSVGARHVPLKLFETNTVSGGGNPEVTLITQRMADNVRCFCCFLHSC